MTTKIQDYHRAKEQKFIDQANRPLKWLRYAGRGLALFFIGSAILYEFVT